MTIQRWAALTSVAILSVACGSKSGDTQSSGSTGNGASTGSGASTASGNASTGGGATGGGGSSAGGSTSHVGTSGGGSTGGGGASSSSSPSGDASSPEAGGGEGGVTIGGDGGNGSTVGCGLEDCTSSCTVPAIPSYSQITTTDAMLPDPFTMLSGTRMTSKSQWECRRAELSAMFQSYELGQKNPKPAGTVTGSYSAGTLTVNAGGKSFTVTITMPTTGKPPYPAIIALDGGSLPTSQITGLGVAMISLSTNTLGDQTASSNRGQGFFFDVNGADSGAGSLIAWAWGVSRVIDALEVTPSAMIDPTHIGMTGCSRNGKGALVAGALDERIQLTIPQESGSGGTASWRVSENEDGGSHTVVQTLEEIIGEDDWFSTSLNQFSGHATKLPEDHHELLGLVAPRGLFILENTSYQWLGVNSCVTDATAAQMIYQGLGVEDSIGFTNSSHTHCAFDSAEWPYLRAYIQRFLLGQSVATNVWHITSTEFGSTSMTIDTSKWIDWTVPTLN